MKMPFYISHDLCECQTCWFPTRIQVGWGEGESCFPLVYQSARVVGNQFIGCGEISVYRQGYDKLCSIFITFSLHGYTQQQIQGWGLFFLKESGRQGECNSRLLWNAKTQLGSGSGNFRKSRIGIVRAG